MIRISKKRRVALAFGAVALGGAVLVPTTTSFGASGTISAVDYAQCANGTGAALDCDEGWTNGILQQSNSHFKEGDVTPQRLIAAISETGEHTVTLKYQARKGTTHAYDSLATWNETVEDADRCEGLSAAVQTAIDCGDDTPTDTFPITPDTGEVIQPFTSASGVTDTHDIPGNLVMFNGDITGMTDPTHDKASCSGKCADDYATTTITFQAEAGSTVQLLFGGHLAVSPLNRGGWGPGLGASNINGGPYHIKWTAADGASVGNRDNQIMGDAIAALTEPGISTAASPTTATPGIAVNLTDTVTLIGATDPTGTATFSLRPYDANTQTCTGAAAFTDLTTSTWTKVGGGTGTGNWTASVTKSAFTFAAPGTYYWVVSVAADANNTSAGPHGCGDATEIVTVARLTPGGSTVILLDDSVTVTGNGSVVPTGTATFKLYKDDATCSDATKLVYDSGAIPLSASATAATTANTVTSAGTYRWLVTYSGDTTYAASTPSNCTETAALSPSGSVTRPLMPGA